ncbi:MAG: pitrilysin family protein [Thermoanaerobaculia bacterium]
MSTVDHCPSSLPIEEHILDNGLRVVLQPDSTLPLVAINLWYHVGSKNERPGRTGFAHLFEHMLFQGSEHVGTNDHFRYVQQVGGVANGSTWYDRTNYYETLPANQMELGLWLEADRMGYLLPALDGSKLEKQREVVMNERRQRVDNQPYGRAMERIHELLYPPGHPYHWPVIGYMEDIAAATLEEVEEFFRTYYVPDNAVLSMVGDVQPVEALAAIERYFGEFPRGGGLDRVTAEPVDLSAERREILHDDVQLARIYLAFPAPPFGEPEWYAADLLSTALAGGKSSPLYQDLVYTRELAQDVAAFVLPLEIGSTFMVVATAKPDIEPQEVEKIITGHLERTADGFPQEELERARNQLLTAHHDGLQAVEQRADLLSLYTTYFSDPSRLANEMESYEKLTSEELARFGRTRLRPDNRVALHVVPKE